MCIRDRCRRPTGRPAERSAGRPVGRLHGAAGARPDVRPDVRGRKSGRTPGLALAWRGRTLVLRTLVIGLPEIDENQNYPQRHRLSPITKFNEQAKGEERRDEGRKRKQKEKKTEERRTNKNTDKPGEKFIGEDLYQ